MGRIPSPDRGGPTFGRIGAGYTWTDFDAKVVYASPNLGGFQLRVDSRAVPLPAKKAQALLAYLALRPGRPHGRDTLMGLLWGEATEQRARHSLRQTVFHLRRVFRRARNAALVVRGDTIALKTAAVSVDALEFQRHLRRGTPAALEAALALYQGALLDGVNVAEASFEEWLRPERERFREAVLEALTKLLTHHTKRGAIEAAAQTATRLLALDPLQETIHRALMRLYARQGRRAHALRQYQVCVRVLQRELGVEPEPETRKVYREVLQQRAPSTRTPDHTGDPFRRRWRGAPAGLREVPSLEPPVVGRRAELARLHDALREVCGGRGRIVVARPAWARLAFSRSSPRPLSSAAGVSWWGDATRPSRSFPSGPGSRRSALDWDCSTPPHSKVSSRSGGSSSRGCYRSFPPLISSRRGRRTTISGSSAPWLE